MEANEFELVYEKNAKKLYNFILWTTGKLAACDDILQNVFYKVWRFGSAPGDERECTAWLYTIARNACFDYFRSTKTFSEYDDEIGGVVERSDEEEDGKFAWSQAARLPEAERAIVYLHVKIGYSYAEIGRFMNMTENHVRVKAFRALRKLREILIKKGL